MTICYNHGEMSIFGCNVNTNEENIGVLPFTRRPYNFACYILLTVKLVSVSVK